MIVAVIVAVVIDVIVAVFVAMLSCNGQRAGSGKVIPMAEVITRRNLHEERAAVAPGLEAQGQIERDAGAGRTASFDARVLQVKRRVTCVQAVTTTGDEAPFELPVRFVEAAERVADLVEQQRENGVVTITDPKL